MFVYSYNSILACMFFKCPMLRHSDSETRVSEIHLAFQRFSVSSVSEGILLFRNLYI